MKYLIKIFCALCILFITRITPNTPIPQTYINQNKVVFDQNAGENISKNHQALWEYATKKIGVPDTLIKYFKKDRESVYQGSQTYLVGVLINKTYFDAVSISLQKFHLLHEAVHVKYKDMKKWLSSPSPEELNNLIKEAEHRADEEALMALDCHLCAREVMEERQRAFECEDNPCKGKGYMEADEMKKFVDFFQLHNRICQDCQADGDINHGPTIS